MNPKEYSDAINRLVSRPDFQPHDGQTFCNLFITEIAHLFGYKGFDGLVANQIIDLMDKGKPFSKIEKPDYKRIAKSATIDAVPTLIIAGQKANGHGHVCAVSPLGGTTFSFKWMKTVCNVDNVGKTVFENKGLNWAFATEPTLYIYQG